VLVCARRSTQFGAAWGPEIGGKQWLPSWEAGRAGLATLRYALWQMGASGMRVLPTWVPPAEEIAEAEATWEHRARATRNTYRSLTAETTAALITACRARGVTASGALCAAAVLGSSDAMGTVEASEADATPQAQRYKLLQALDMRTLNFTAGGAETPGARDDWSGGTVLAGTGSLDILVDLPPSAGATVRGDSGGGGPSGGGPGGGGGGGPPDLAAFWACAAECNEQTREWIRAGWARESLLLFASGWEFMNMNRVVELGSQDRATLGRAYSAGVSNVGVYAHETRHGDLSITRVHFGISQTVSAPAISTSAVTVDGTLCLTTQYATPIWPSERAEAYADGVARTLELAAAEAT